MKDKFLDFGKITLVSNGVAKSENTIDLGSRERSIVEGFVELTLPSSTAFVGNLQLAIESSNDNVDGNFKTCGASRIYTPTDLKGDVALEKGKPYHGAMTRIRMPLPFDIGRFVRVTVTTSGADVGKVVYGSIETA